MLCLSRLPALCVLILDFFSSMYVLFSGVAYGANGFRSKVNGHILAGSFAVEFSSV